MARRIFHGPENLPKDVENFLRQRVDPRIPEPNAVMELPKGHNCRNGDNVRVRLDDGSVADAIYICQSEGWSKAYKLHIVQVVGARTNDWVGPDKPTKTKLRFVYPVEKMELYRAKTNN